MAPKKKLMKQELQSLRVMPKTFEKFRGAVKEFEADGLKKYAAIDKLIDRYLELKRGAGK